MGDCVGESVDGEQEDGLSDVGDSDDGLKLVGD